MTREKVDQIDSCFQPPRPKGYVKPVVNTGEGVTKQEFRDECDINVIMERYRKTGVIAFRTSKQPIYMDCSEFPTSLQDALEYIKKGDELFAEMPSHLRKEFDNDPSKFIEFVQDKNNLDKAYEMGLIDRPEGYVESQPEITKESVDKSE
jgi:phage internal scaffolding protein